MRKYFYLLLGLLSSLMLTCDVNAYSYRTENGSCSIMEYGSAPARGIDMFITGSCTSGTTLKFKLYDDNTLCSPDGTGCTFYTSLVPITGTTYKNDYTALGVDPFGYGRETLLSGFSYYPFLEEWKYSKNLGGVLDRKSATAYISSTSLLVLDSTLALYFNSDSTFGVALHGDYIESANGGTIIKNVYDTLVKNVDMEKQDEQLETSKSIWQSLKDLISSLPEWFSNLANSIGNFFSDLKDGIGGFFENMLNGIKELFYGKEEKVCTTYTNYFNGYDASNLLPDANGWVTINFAKQRNFFAYALANANIVAGKDYNVFFEFDEVSANVLLLSPFDGRVVDGVSQNAQIRDTSYRFYNRDGQTDIYNGVKYNKVFTANDASDFMTLYGYSHYNSVSFKIRILVTDNLDMTLDNYEYFQGTKDVCTTTGTSGGLFGIIDNFKSAIGNWFKELLSGILDGIKALFVPTDDQLYEIIDDSKELTENFGFVGESVSFFITIFTSLLGLVNANGCVELPEFSIGETSLFPAHKFWDKQLVCLNDNEILSSNISTIRTITSIVLVGMFVNFAASKFFSILSKNDYGTSTTYDSDGTASTYDWSRVNGDTTIYRR